MKRKRSNPTIVTLPTSKREKAIHTLISEGKMNSVIRRLFPGMTTEEINLLRNVKEENYCG